MGRQRRGPAVDSTGPARLASDEDPVERLLTRARAELSGRPRPFVRWAGSKRRLLTHLLPHVPLEYGRYWEPFLGSGALYFLLQPEGARLNDYCEPLMRTYRAVRDGPRAVARTAASWPVDRTTYYMVRDEVTHNRFTEAGRFIYLNKTCWNGLYRVNGKGAFNVPYGRPRTSNVVDEDNLASCSALLRTADTLRNDDFEDFLVGVARDDFVYLDPPYVTRHNNNGFIDYNERLFTWEDQKRLAAVAARLAAAGAHVVVSNAHHNEVIELFPKKHFRVAAIERRSTLAGDISKRTRVSEAVIVSH